MGGAGSMNWGKGKNHTGLWWGGYLKERGHLKNLGVDGRIILKCIINRVE
jgi:hypothetical protein